MQTAPISSQHPPAQQGLVPPDPGGNENRGPSSNGVPSPDRSVGVSTHRAEARVESNPTQVGPQQQRRLQNYKITEGYFRQVTMESYSLAEAVGIGLSSCLVSLFTMSYSFSGVAFTAPLLSLTSLTKLATAAAAMVGITTACTVGTIGLGCGVRWLMLYLRGDLDRCDAKLNELEARYQSIQNGTDPATQQLSQSRAHAVYVDDDLPAFDDRTEEQQYLRRRMRMNHQDIRTHEAVFRPSNMPYLRSAPTYFAKSRYLSGPAAAVMVHRGIQANTHQPTLDWQRAQSLADAYESAEFDDDSTNLLKRALDEQTGGLYSAYRKEGCYRNHLQAHREYNRYIQRNSRERANLLADRDYLEPQTRFGRLRIWWRELLED